MSDDEGDEVVFLWFTVVNETIKIDGWPKRRPVRASRVCLVPRDIDFFNATSHSGDLNRTLYKRFRGAMTLTSSTIVRLIRGVVPLHEVVVYERVTTAAPSREQAPNVRGQRRQSAFAKERFAQLRDEAYPNSLRDLCTPAGTKVPQDPPYVASLPTLPE